MVQRLSEFLMSINHSEHRYECVSRRGTSWRVFWLFYLLWRGATYLKLSALGSLVLGLGLLLSQSIKTWKNKSQAKLLPVYSVRNYCSIKIILHHRIWLKRKERLIKNIFQIKIDKNIHFIFQAVKKCFLMYLFY